MFSNFCQVFSDRDYAEVICLDHLLSFRLVCENLLPVFFFSLQLLPKLLHRQETLKFRMDQCMYCVVMLLSVHQRHQYHGSFSVWANHCFRLSKAVCQVRRPHSPSKTHKYRMLECIDVRRQMCLRLYKAKRQLKSLVGIGMRRFLCFPKPVS